MNVEFDLQQNLPQLIPAAVTWAEEHARYIERAGKPLSESWMEVARSVGVEHAERVRIAVVDEMPLPGDELLQAAALSTGLLGPHTSGLTLGYGIYLVEREVNVRLVSHEFRHVQQYEAYGSIGAFLAAYLGEIAEHGYQNAPLEMDARAHEIQAS